MALLRSFVTIVVREVFGLYRFATRLKKIPCFFHAMFLRVFCDQSLTLMSEGKKKYTFFFGKLKLELSRQGRKRVSGYNSNYKLPKVSRKVRVTFLWVPPHCGLLGSNWGMKEPMCWLGEVFEYYQYPLDRDYRSILRQYSLTT